MRVPLSVIPLSPCQKCLSCLILGVILRRSIEGDVNNLLSHPIKGPSKVKASSSPITHLGTSDMAGPTGDYPDAALVPTSSRKSACEWQRQRFCSTRRCRCYELQYNKQPGWQLRILFFLERRQWWRRGEEAAGRKIWPGQSSLMRRRFMPPMPDTPRPAQRGSQRRGWSS